MIANQKFIKLVVFIFCLGLAYNISAQTSILQGKVIDSVTKEPLPFATIILFQNGTQKGGVLADIEGNYVIKAVNPGKYEIHVGYMGYKTVKIIGCILKPDQITFINFTLSPSTLQLSEFVITEYSSPLIEEDRGSTYYVDGRSSSTRTVASVTHLEKEPEIKSDPAIHSSTVDGHGILTAGEINDYGKWDMWTDISKKYLKEWQICWQFSPLERYSIQVITQNGRPLIDCKVALCHRDHLVWETKTDNTGKAELWANLYGNSNRKLSYSLKIEYEGKNYRIDEAVKFDNGINYIKLPVGCANRQKADICFVVDATGSMADEIEFLKSELNDIIGKVKTRYPGIIINTAAVFYRDNGDEYVTRKSEFTTDFQQTIGFINSQDAGGGGDAPEAVDSALDVAVNHLSWSEQAVSRMMFMVLDAPPHNGKSIISSLHKTIQIAASKGIHIIPVSGSGIDKSSEYLYRSFALATNGRYVFLTDHSHVGESHIKPTTDQYDVKLLNDLLLKIVSQYLYVPPCDNDSVQDSSGISDTMLVWNPDVITSVCPDSLLKNKLSSVNFPPDTVKFDLTVGQLDKETDLPDKIKQDSIAISDSISIAKIDRIEASLVVFRNFKYYPNPTSGILNIEIQGKIDVLYLADISGKLLEKYNVADNKSLKIDLSKFPTGIYFIQYNLDGKWLAGKVLLNRNSN